ncbi:MAG TPA: hypothetical protein GXX31_05210 [Methanothermobacter sp.]|jgi:hypothetical protein|uniref:Uncharacterized protein n=1 Tax=Methanothermobacter tenebrarum TaxID=680118 RepID=A0ABM7YEL7_9EURY|nr:hypothetical protein [Methanothermobacter tenebrarum]MDD3454514.1 hypothetical protein [Methanobacteriales archaeon]MDI6882482.1 hypothetical protein [Methanothermobacter sp.]MDX9693014.1 hypothetical protein [Methanothermobacter sp.]BDH79851.1 hypothetical protein MTTB_12300 [Methanothermobacter tenebrarum]HHW16753.1 hypothetical protein [Methanothermobacter sp.]
MKRSRLRLFKFTSMTISVFGVLMIIATVIVLAYIGIERISSTISTNVDKGSLYDEYAQLQKEYQDLEIDYDSTKKTIYESGNKDLMEKYINAEIKLVEAKSALDDVQSALSTNKPIPEIKNRLQTAKLKLKEARDSLASLKS